MAKEGKTAVMPRLRFPDFQDAPGWETAPLEEIAERITTKNADGKVTRVLTNSAEYGILDQHDYFDREIATAGKVDSYYIVDAGDYVYNPRTSAIAPVGPISRNNIGKGVMSPLYTVFRFTAEKTDFYEHYFRSNRWHAYVRNAASTGARHDRMSITTGAFMQMPVPIPDESEQQKIADCLTSLDALIAAQGRIVEALKSYKRGLMQQIFPREGETRPRLRFPEFHNAGEWVCEELSCCLEKIIDYRGKAPPKSDSGVPLITARNVRFGWLDMTNDEYIGEGEFVGWMSKGIPQVGDVLFTTEAPLGNAALIPSAGRFALGQRILTLRPRSEKCLPEFLFQSLLGPRMQKEIDFHSTGTTAKGIKSAVFVKISFCFPGIDEQRRIADYLNSLDEISAREANELAALNTHKKGLMQQLFPSLEAV